MFVTYTHLCEIDVAALSKTDKMGERDPVVVDTRHARTIVVKHTTGCVVTGRVGGSSFLRPIHHTNQHNTIFHVLFSCYFLRYPECRCRLRFATTTPSSPALAKAPGSSFRRGLGSAFGKWCPGQWLAYRRPR